MKQQTITAFAKEFFTMSIEIITTIIIGLTIIAMLSIYAYKLTQKVRQIESENARRIAEIDAQAERVMDEVALDVGIIARAYTQNEVSATEAVIRITTILAKLQLTDLYKGVYPAVFELAERTSHIPILEEWKALSPRDKFKFDKERYSAEEELKPALDIAMKSLINFKRPVFLDAAS